MDDIREWLRGRRDYATGARLYLIHGSDHKLRRVFSEPESEWKLKKLVEVLTEMVTRKKAITVKVEETKAKALDAVSVANRRWPDTMDETVKALHAKWLPLFAEMNNLMARIYDTAKAGISDAVMKWEAGIMAHRICDLDDECDAIYAQRDHYLKFGKLPEEKKPMELVVDPMKMPLALSNARRYVADYRNKLKKEPGNVKAAVKLKKYEWAVAEYCRILKIDV